MPLFDEKHASEPPPGAWKPARRAARKLVRPVERFLRIEAASGLLLLAAAAIALIWANSPWAGSYQALWHTSFGLRLGDFAFERDLHFWINDGLMAVFFFHVGLEIRREIHAGELSEARRAALPLAAALGGMVVPALIYTALNRGGPAADGWGVPMATDIAFAVGILTLLGKRVLPALRVLLLALAVIDDVGAILVIAFFYSSGISGTGLLIMGGGLVAIWVLRVVGVRTPIAYVPAGVVVWAGTYAAGMHPTLAGVILGLLTPVVAWFAPQKYADAAAYELEGVRSAESPHEVLHHLDALGRLHGEAVSPVDRLQHALHGWVSYAIMPLFALANAGVPLGAASFEAGGMEVFVGVVVGLVVGKFLGILSLSWLAVRLGLAALPRGVRWRGVAIVGLVGGIGFTMALFIAGLGIEAGPLLETAKLGILCASAGAAVLAFVIGRVVLPVRTDTNGSATSEGDAESSTEL